MDGNEHSRGRRQRTGERAGVKAVNDQARPGGGQLENLICVRGLFRSGTNYTKALLETNFDCLTVYDAYGWKHAPFPILSRTSKVRMPKMPVLFVVKNPFHATISLYEYARSRQANLRSDRLGSIEDFVRGEVVIRNSEHPRSPEIWFPDIAVMWTQITWNALSAAEVHQTRRLLKYEDLLQRPEDTLNPVAEHFGLQRRAGDFQVPEKKLRNLRENAHTPDAFFHERDFDRESALKGSYMDALPAAALEFLLDRVPAALIARLGYDDIVARARETVDAGS